MLNKSLQSGDAVARIVPPQYVECGHPQDNGEWELVDATSERNEIVYDCCPEPYIDVTVTLQLRYNCTFVLYC